MGENGAGNSQQVGAIAECFGLLRGLYRELFGVFIPGAITTCFFIALPVLTYVAVMGKFEDLKRIILSGFGNVSAAGAGVSVVTSADGNLVHFFLGILFFIVAYAIGGILWRRPIEHADAVAAFRQWCFAKPENLERLTVQFGNVDLTRMGSLIDGVQSVLDKLKLVRDETDSGCGNAKIELETEVKRLIGFLWAKDERNSLWQKLNLPYVRNLCDIIELREDGPFKEELELDVLANSVARFLTRAALEGEAVERRLSNLIDSFRRDLACARQLRNYEESLRSVARYRGSLQHLIELLADPFWGGGRGEVIARGSFVNIIYPYPYLRCYLLARGLKGLARFVGWCGFSLDEGSVCGGKNVINLLKYRIRYYGDVDMVKEIDRNECHIRMLNSLWYSFRFVRTMIMFSVLVVVSGYVINDVSVFVMVCSIRLLIALTVAFLVSAIIGLWLTSVRGRIVVQNRKSRRVVFVVTSLVCFAACYISCFMGLSCPPEIYVTARWFVVALLILGYAVTFCRRNIEKGFHYVREREIIFILTSADILQREARKWKGKNRKIFQDLLPKGDDCDHSICKSCVRSRKCYARPSAPRKSWFDGIVPTSWEI